MSLTMAHGRAYGSSAAPQWVAGILTVPKQSGISRISSGFFVFRVFLYGRFWMGGRKTCRCSAGLSTRLVPPTHLTVGGGSFNEPEHTIMATLPSTLDFEKTTLSIVDHNGTAWLSAADLARALDYKRTDSVSRIYDRNKDEFTNGMTETVKLTVNGFGQDSAKKDIRIFSPRGCHLVAMFARTDRAKSFRRWTLDVLDNLNKPEPRKTYETITKQQYKELTRAVHSAGHWFGESGTQGIYNRIRVEANIHRIDTLPVEYYEPVMEQLDQLKDVALHFSEWKYDLNQKFVKEVIHKGTPWTPSLKTKWKKLFEQPLPARPDWLAIEKQVSKKLEEVK